MFFFHYFSFIIYFLLFYRSNILIHLLSIRYLYPTIVRTKQDEVAFHLGLHIKINTYRRIFRRPLSYIRINSIITNLFSRPLSCYNTSHAKQGSSLQASHWKWHTQTWIFWYSGVPLKHYLSLHVILFKTCLSSI